MRRFLWLSALVLVGGSFSAMAINAPEGQTPVAQGQVLRGAFSEDKLISGIQNPLHLSGHFVLAPGKGLLWNMEKPFPTSTIITPGGMVQQLAGATVKLPVKNYKHLYDMIGGALAGNWNGVAPDFNVTASRSPGQWQMLLTPKPDATVQLGYATITVTGVDFVHSINMVKMDGSYDRFDFQDGILAPGPLTPAEQAAFDLVR